MSRVGTEGRGKVSENRRGEKTVHLMRVHGGREC